MKGIIMIPTYNERDNITALVETIFSLKLRPENSLQIVVVDDASPDGTAESVRSLQEKHPGRLFLIERENERGRGTAGITGFLFCLEQEVDCILEMDADFSHDPKYLPVFLALVEYYDVVIGSRFVQGGDDAYRRANRTLISICANWVYRAFLGIRLRDISGGYKCYRKAALARLDFSKFYSTGYPIGMETVYRCYLDGAQFIEMPIHFKERKQGVSKFIAKEALNAFLVAARLGLKFRGRAR